MERIRVGDSGIFEQGGQARPARVQPETVILLIAWLLSVTQIAVGLLRGDGFGADRALAIAFAIGCPVLARGALIGGVRRYARMFRGR
jgi:hypothetical protein